MSNGRGTQGNRNLSYLGLIIAIVAIVVTIFLAILEYSPPPPDFSISINPMQGAVHQGGVITTAITIESVHGYEEPVSLSATEQPSGVVLAFVPQSGEAKPSYTSHVTIIVNSSVPVGDYTITIKGIGADGKQHQCIYTLIVKPSVKLTSTPKQASQSGLAIAFYQSPISKVTRGTQINFNWEITKEPPSFLAGESYLLEIQGPTDKQRYSQVFQTPRESCSNFTDNYSWIVPDDEALGSYTSGLKFYSAGAYTTFEVVETLLVIQMFKFNDTNLNGKIESSDERLAGWKFKITDPGGEITTRLTDYSGEIRLEVPAQYEGKEYIIEETLLPFWEPVLPIKQTVKVLKGEGITVNFLNKEPIPITLTYNDFELENVCTPEDNYCGWANVPGKAIIYGSMTTNITVPEGANKLEVTISIGCNGDSEGLSGQAGSATCIRVDNEVREERIDSTMNSHHGNYYKYEWCDTFSNKFNVTKKEEITLIIEMSGGARLDFKDAILKFS